MASCANCRKELSPGDNYRVMRIQMWKTSVGSMECEPPDLDKTVSYCLPCAKDTRISVWQDGGK